MGKNFDMFYGSVTKNYGLLKPDEKDKVSVNDLNANSDSIERYLTDMTVALTLKAPINNPVFLGIVTAPDTYNENNSSRVITENTLNAMLTVKEVVLCKSKEDFPAEPKEGCLYILTNDANTKYSEHIWNGSRYIPELKDE